MSLADRIKRYEKTFSFLTLNRIGEGIGIRTDILPTYQSINEAIGGLLGEK